jgi:hypothetical protein
VKQEEKRSMEFVSEGAVNIQEMDNISAYV